MDQLAKQIFEDAEFQTRDGVAYCNHDFKQRFCPKCAGCGRPITTKEFSVALGKQYHREHFVCTACQSPLNSAFVADEQARPYCDADCFEHFESQRA